MHEETKSMEENRGRTAFELLCAAFLILGVSAVLAVPFLVHRKLPESTDLAFSIQLTKGMLEGWLDGRLYPCWIDGMNYGLGGPALCFYPPLAYWATAPLLLLTDNLALSVALAAWAAFFLSGLAFYWAARDFTSPRGAAVGAVAYVLLPYHVLDLYDRWAFAEIASFAWLPLVFCFTRRLARGTVAQGGIPASSVLGLAVSFGGLILTHLITAYLVLYALVPYALWHVVRERAGCPVWKRLAWIAAGGLVGALAAAVYLAPVALERDTIDFEHFVHSLYGSWPRNFVFDDAVRQGYTVAKIKPRVEAALLVTTVLALGAAMLSWSRFSGRSGGLAVRREAVVMAALVGWTFFLQTSLSKPVWQLDPWIGTAQFPWRFSAVTTLAAAWLLAAALAPAASRAVVESPLEHRPKRRLVRGAGVLFVILGALAGLALGLRFALTAEYVVDRELAHHVSTHVKVKEEYFPRQVQDAEAVHDLRRDLWAPTVILGAGHGRVRSWTSHERTIDVDMREAGRVRVRTFAHAGWRAEVDGVAVPIEAAPPTALIELAVPAGEHEVRVFFTSTPARRLGAAISVLGIVLLLALASSSLYNRRGASRSRDADDEPATDAKTTARARD